MEFDCCEAKHKKNLEEREFNFAVQIFLGHVLSQIDDRVDTRESRIKAIGEVDGVVLVSSTLIEMMSAGSSLLVRRIGRSAHYSTHDT